jgi:DNA-binding XRE family transcriptional regulator
MNDVSSIYCPFAYDIDVSSTSAYHCGMYITASQIRAARGLIGVSQDGLARRSGISRATLSAIEGGADTKASIMVAIQQALELRGVVFGRDGGIAQKMEWRDPVPDRETRRRLTEATNMLRSARHDPPVVDPLEDE